LSPRVRLESEEDGRILEIEAETGELLSQVAYRSGVTLHTTCGGKASCTDCRVVIKEGLKEGFEKPEGPEIRALGNVFHITRERLACQAIVAGDSTVLVPKPVKKKRR